MALDFVQFGNKIFSFNNNMTRAFQKSIKILNKPTQSIQDLSKIYRRMKEEGLNITWMDVLRKSSRNNVKDKIEVKLMQTRKRHMKDIEKVIKEADKEINEIPIQRKVEYFQNKDNFNKGT